MDKFNTRWGRRNQFEIKELKVVMNGLKKEIKVNI